MSHKDAWLREHERLYAEYVDAHPDCTDAEAMAHADAEADEAAKQVAAAEIDATYERFRDREDPHAEDDYMARRVTRHATP